MYSFMLDVTITSKERLFYQELLVLQEINMCALFNLRPTIRQLVQLLPFHAGAKNARGMTRQTIYATMRRLKEKNFVTTEILHDALGAPLEISLTRDGLHYLQHNQCRIATLAFQTTTADATS